HQNKPDIGAAIVRKWLDEEHVAAVTDVPNSAVALAINTLMAEKNRVLLASSTATSDLTGKFCKPTTVQWDTDTWAQANGTARGVVQNGGKNWFFIAVDYALGAALERDTAAVVKALGGDVMGDVREPLGTSDFSSYLLAAQNSRAQVIGLATTGADAINLVKQAAEFGIRQGGQTLAGLFLMITDVDALGLKAAQGLILTDPFYWDLNDNTRAFAKRFAARMDGRMPTGNHAGVYSSVLAYLRAAKAADTLDGAKVVEQMRQAPIQDPLFGTVTIRADGRAVHAMHVFRVKSPEQSKGRWDDWQEIATIPPDQAFRPLDQGGCPLVERH
ncbi:MAG: ABC transporter substrate-binding protein, partial [Alphaproteobacteria bacterium]|nr:ABC transporter substrate-binding protein [Alphaproteobacteria bacterium]